MKKILLTDDMRLILEKEGSFLSRSDIGLITASSHEEALGIHRDEIVNLIITRLNMPQMSSEMFCSLIREDKELCNVSIIIVCEDNPSAIARSSACKANAVIPLPVSAGILLEKTHQLLNISRRESYRVLMSLKIEGRCREIPFLCRAENVSVSGMLIETDKVLEKGEKLTCSFYLRDSTHIIAEGEIVRVAQKTTEFDTNQYGIKFSRIAPEAKSALEEFIRKESERRNPSSS